MVELERLEAKFATAGEASAADLEIYQRCSSALRRLLEAVGLRRRPRDLSLVEGVASQPFTPLRARLRAETIEAAEVIE